MTRKQLIVLRELIHEILQGLNGNKFEWNQGQRYNWVPILRKAGITLVSATQLKKHGYRLKNRQNPVGSAYFGAPIQRQVDLFVLEIQTVRDTKLTNQSIDPILTDDHR
jgi:hypothetical protein